MMPPGSYSSVKITHLLSYFGSFSKKTKPRNLVMPDPDSNPPIPISISINFNLKQSKTIQKYKTI